MAKSEPTPKRRQVQSYGMMPQSYVYGKDYPSGWLFWRDDPDATRPEEKKKEEPSS